MSASSDPTVGGVLIVLDVDGTIAPLTKIAAGRAGNGGGVSWLPHDERIIEALNLHSQRSGVHVAWLTTWTRNQDDVDKLVERGLQGRLAGDRVPWIGWPARGWRMRSVRTYLESAMPMAVVWADDQAPRDARRRLSEALSIPCLVIRPQREVGLTMRDCDRISDFILGLAV